MGHLRRWPQLEDLDPPRRPDADHGQPGLRSPAGHGPSRLPGPPARRQPALALGAQWCPLTACTTWAIAIVQWVTPTHDLAALRKLGAWRSTPAALIIVSVS